jgi:hypothetical protein
VAPARDVAALREGLLQLWLGAEKGEVLARRIVAEGIAEAVVSGTTCAARRLDGR